MQGNARITFVGTGDAFGSGGRLQTCFHVRTPELAFLIDCGATTCIGMKRCGIGHDDIDAVIISHFHADHFAGLPFLLIEGRVIGRTRPLHIVGPPGIRERVAQAMEVLFPGAGAPGEFPVEYTEYRDSESVDAGTMSITAWPVVHAPATSPHALRIDVAGRTIAYSGDTEWADALIDVAKDADVFICEVSGFDGPVGIHLDYPSLLEHRPDIVCRRMVITHMGTAVLDNADTVAAGLDATIAYDGLVLDL